MSLKGFHRNSNSITCNNNNEIQNEEILKFYGQTSSQSLPINSFSRIPQLEENKNLGDLKESNYNFFNKKIETIYENLFIKNSFAKENDNISSSRNLYNNFPNKLFQSIRSEKKNHYQKWIFECSIYFKC